ncbi:MAG TPA: hypothetical protein VFV49_05670, partial [Thermoanaerobaculia bacterium]|nr:hypothetical protein [Thermoanaerobaculia bacterium]
MVLSLRQPVAAYRLGRSISATCLLIAGYGQPIRGKKSWNRGNEQQHRGNGQRNREIQKQKR